VVQERRYMAFYVKAASNLVLVFSYTSQLIQFDDKNVTYQKNVIIYDNGTPKIYDFGLVRVLFPDGSSGMTTTTPHWGTPKYLAPELLKGKAHMGFRLYGL
jgi:serine/threonine protein kinase